MSNPAPILTLAGKVHAVDLRDVPAAEAREARYDEETGRQIAPAYPARDAYQVVDVTVLTDEGGFATAMLMPDSAKALNGELPSSGDVISWPVRPFVSWQRSGSRSFNRVGLSVAGDVLADRKSKTSGARVASVSSASA